MSDQAPVKRLDTNDPETLKALTTSGLIWKGGPQTIQRAISAIVGGDISLDECRNMPPEIRAHIDQLMSEGVPTNGQSESSVPQDSGVPQPAEQAPVAEQPQPEGPQTVMPGDLNAPTP